MKVLKYIFIGVVCLVLLAIVAAVIFLSTFDIERFKPQIISQIESTIHRDVAIADLRFDFSVNKGITLNLRGLSISDDKDFSQEDFLSIEEVHLQVDFLALLRQRQLRATELSVRSPNIVVIRDAQGRLNVESLSPQEASSGATGTAGPGSSEKPPASSPPGVVPPVDIVISSLTVQDGQLRYIDKSFQPPVSITVDQFRMKVEDISLDKPFDMLMEAAVWSREPNVTVRGRLESDLKEMEFSIKEGTADVNLSMMSLEKIQQSFAQLQALGLTDLKGTLRANVRNAVVSPEGLKKLSLTGELREGRLALKMLAVPVEKLQASLEMDESVLKINEMSAVLGSGSAAAKGTIRDYLQKQLWQFQADLKGILLQEVLKQEKQDVQVLGALQGNLDFQGQGFGDTSTLLQFMQGEGKVELQEGQLKNINLLRLVLEKISLIPNLVEQLQQTLPEKYKDMLKQSDTDLDKVLLRISAGDGLLRIPSAQLEAQGFGINADGSLDPQQNLVLQAILFIVEDLSAGMIKSVELLGNLQDEKKRIAIPLKKYSGPLAGYRPFPDLEFLAKKMAVQEGREQLKKVLQKALGTEKTPEGETPPAQGETTPEATPKEKSPEEEMIDSVLDLIFQ